MPGIESAAKKKLSASKENILFSSDDSFNTDNSFNSSVDDDCNDDYKNPFFHLKEEMNQIFVESPELLENMRFEAFNPENHSNEDQQNRMKQAAAFSGGNASSIPTAPVIPKPNYITQESKLQEFKQIKEKEQKEKSRLWSALSQNIVRDGQTQLKIPALDTVHHRLNMYKQDITRLDYIEIMSNELGLLKKPNDIPEGSSQQSNLASSMLSSRSKHRQSLSQHSSSQLLQQQQQQQKKITKKSNNIQGSASDEENDGDGKIVSGDIEYFSFKKRMQMKAKVLREKQLQQKLDSIQDKRRMSTFGQVRSSSGTPNQNAQYLYSIPDSVDNADQSSKQKKELLITKTSPGTINQSQFQQQQQQQKLQLQQQQQLITQKAMQRTSILLPSTQQQQQQQQQQSRKSMQLNMVPSITAVVTSPSIAGLDAQQKPKKPMTKMSSAVNVLGEQRKSKLMMNNRIGSPSANNLGSRVTFGIEVTETDSTRTGGGVAAAAASLNDEAAYKSKIGKALEQVKVQSKGDKAAFRKNAASTLQEYSKNKAILLKPKKFPQPIPKFVSEENVFLNHLLPDYNNPLFGITTSKSVNDPFEENKDYHPISHSIEAELLSSAESVVGGDLLNIWKMQSSH